MKYGNEIKNICHLAWPAIIQEAMNTVVTYVDTGMVGSMGATASAAVGLTSTVTWLLGSISVAFGVGVLAVCAQSDGAKDYKKVQIAGQQALFISFIIGLITTIISIIIAPFLPGWLNGAKEIRHDAFLYFLIVSSITNIILDLLFVVVLKMGIAGVGWATLISQTISAILTLILLIKTKQEYKVTLKKIRFHKERLIEIIRLGLPSGIQNGVVSFSNVIVQSNINAFGSVAMAGCGAYTKIDGFAILPVMSFSMALTTFTGQNMGANKLERVHQGAKTGIFMSVATTVVISILLELFGPQVLSIFTDNQQVIHYGLYMLHILAPCYIFLAISHAFSGIIRGAGITTIPMIVMISCWCVLRMAWILTSVPIFHDIGVVFMGWPITWFASALWLFLYYKKGNWMKQN